MFRVYAQQKKPIFGRDLRLTFLWYPLSSSSSLFFLFLPVLGVEPSFIYPVVVAHAFNPGTWEAEAGDSL